MKSLPIVLTALGSLILANAAFAKGGGYSGGHSSGSSHSSGHTSSSHGASSGGAGKETGSGYTNPNSHNVRGYTKNDGTYVAPHRQTNPNNTGKDNYSTKNNRNPDTGKEGTKYVNK